MRMHLRRWSLICACLAASAVLLEISPALGAEESPAKPRAKERTVGILLFEGFELLDAFGPAEMFGNVNQITLVMVAEHEGPVKSYSGPSAHSDYSLENCPDLDILLVPGGFGSLKLAKNEKVLDWIREQSQKVELTTSVCSGSAVLAKAGILDGRRATTNKVFYSQCTAYGPNVEWVKEARWVDDGNIVTSSGVSAGMDMALHVISRLYGERRAEQIAVTTEYTWHREADVDPFVKYAR